MPATLPHLPRRGAGVALLATACALVVQGCGGGHRSATAPPVSNGQVAPSCVPAQLNGSAVLGGSGVAVSPLPGSRDASPSTQISMLGARARDLSQVTAVGSISGNHGGVLLGYSQRDGASFLPSLPFQGGESVTVSGQVRRGGAEVPFSYRFTVSQPDPIPHVPPGQPAAARPGEVRSFHSRPGLHPPTTTVTVNGPGVAPGYVLATPYAGPGQAGPLIFDNRGQVVWFDRLPRGMESTNLEVQHYQGRPVLTWWQGYIPPQGFGEGEDVIADSSYRHIAVVHAGNGFFNDLHEFQLAPHARALTTVFNPIRCDLRSAGGPANGDVTDGVYQEIDVKTGLVRREWHSLDHVSLKASYPQPQLASAKSPYDYFHINSLDVEPDGDVLISARSTWTVYDVDATSGVIRTQLGGKNSDVKLGRGADMAWQHDARVLPDGTITIFDNGAAPTIHPQSRGIVLRLDQRTASAALVREFAHPSPHLSAASQGNFQTLPNGDAFLGFGPQPYFSEFNSSGRLVFDARLPASGSSYRGYRFPWTGTPLDRPAIAVTRLATGGMTVFASWNGATRVVAWRTLAGPSLKLLRAAATAPRAGFETPVVVYKPGPWFEVQALDGAGKVLGSSRPVKVAASRLGRGGQPVRPGSAPLVADRPQTADTSHR
jgi:hypothetical protein